MAIPSVQRKTCEIILHPKEIITKGTGRNRLFYAMLRIVGILSSRYSLTFKSTSYTFYYLFNTVSVTWTSIDFHRCACSHPTSIKVTYFLQTTAQQQNCHVLLCHSFFCGWKYSSVNSVLTLMSSVLPDCKCVLSSPKSWLL